MVAVYRGVLQHFAQHTAVLDRYSAVARPAVLRELAHRHCRLEQHSPLQPITAALLSDLLNRGHQRGNSASVPATTARAASGGLQSDMSATNDQTYRSVTLKLCRILHQLVETNNHFRQLISALTDPAIHTQSGLEHDSTTTYMHLAGLGMRTADHHAR